MKEFGVDIPFEIIVGDITLSCLGIEDRDIISFKNQNITMWHLAAIYDLAVKEEIAWKVNVEGTKMVCAFVRDHLEIEQLIYFSTAYVAGRREGTLLETELVRPGIARGHSLSGKTIKFDGPYFFMNMIDRLKWLPFIPYVGKSDAHINVVPIDYIIDATIYLASNKNSAGGQPFI